MRQVIELEKKRLSSSFIEVFRKIFAFFLILSFSGPVEAQGRLGNESVPVLYRAQKYKEVILSIESKELKDGEVLSYKDYAFLIKSYQHMGNINGQLTSIEKAIQAHPGKDIFKREKAQALEQKSNSYIDRKPYEIEGKDLKKEGSKKPVDFYAKMKKDLRSEAVKILNDLYTESPSKENFTALIGLYSREKNYDETIGLLEVYARTNQKGRIYFTYLCEAQYQAKMYVTAKETCRNLKTNYPGSEKGHIFYGQALKKTGSEKEAGKSFVKIVSRFPASSSIQYEAGKALIEDGKREEGLKHIEKHLEIESTDDALLLKATTLFSLRKYDDALEAFVKACKTRKKKKSPLLAELRKAAAEFPRKTERRLKYDKEIRRCKYVYGAKRKARRGVLGRGRYSN